MLLRSYPLGMTCQLFTRCEAAQRSTLTTEAFIPTLQSEVPRTNLQRVVLNGAGRAGERLAGFAFFPGGGTPALTC